MLRKKFTENSVYSQFFSFEVLGYFDSICTDENYEWIDKYFEVLMKEENKTAEKFNKHHIRPCHTFKDKEHKTRKQTKPLADEFNGNLIKLSVYNHLFAHHCLWKIFNDYDSKMAFQRMCGQGKYIDNLTENELKEIARLKEECAKKNQTEEEKREQRKQYNENHKKERKEYSKQRYENNKERITKQHKDYYEYNKEEILERQKERNKNNKEKIAGYSKEYRKNNKEKISKKLKEWYENNKEDVLNQQKQYYKNNKEKIAKYHKEWQENNKEKLSEQNKKRNKLLCFDPIKENECSYNTLRGRKYHHKELYKNVKLANCIIKKK